MSLPSTPRLVMMKVRHYLPCPTVSRYHFIRQDQKPYLGRAFSFSLMLVPSFSSFDVYFFLSSSFSSIDF